MTVDPRERDQMANLIRIMNAGLDESPDSERVFESQVSNKPQIETAVSDKDAMKKILQAFYSANDAVVETAKTNPVLKEALDTTVSDNGVSIGHFNIISKDTYWDVFDNSTGKLIAENLSLYDAAYGIAKFLYEGAMINDSRIKAILVAETEYDKSRQDAAFFQSKIALTEGRKQAIMEDRFDVAFNRAKVARKTVSDIIKR